MENKKTTELLDLLTKLIDKEGNLLEGWDEAWEELKGRHPFWDLFDEDYDESLPALREEIDDLKVEIKKLKRHKHHLFSGDVLIRI